MTGPESPQARWKAVLDSEKLADGESRLVRLGRLPVVVVRRGADLHALGGICPHDLASLSGARIRGNELVCPRHGARFRLADGVCEAGFSLPPLPCYPVRLRQGRVEVDAAAVERDPPGSPVRERWDLTRP